jgi:hypothetical protein
LGKGWGLADKHTNKGGLYDYLLDQVQILLREGVVASNLSIGEISRDLGQSVALFRGQIGRGSCLLDPQGKFHALYEAYRQSLYFIRPDGYIGLRSQPVSEEQLLGYLGKIFSLATEGISSPLSVRRGRTRRS